MSDFEYPGNCDKVSTCLHMAIKKGYAVIDDDIRKDDVNTKDSDGMLPIHIACEIGSAVVVKKLLNHGASINSLNGPKFQPLHLAAENGHEEVIELLLREGANINANEDNFDGVTPLHLAVSAGLLKTVKQLLSRGAAVNVRDAHDQTALQMAVEMEFVEIVEILLDYNANVGAKAVYSLTPLHFSVNGKISKMLLDKGADVNAKTIIWKQTPLHGKKNAETVKVLLEYGVDVNSVNYRGETALFGCRDETIARMMLEKGAHVNLRKPDGRTALHFAAWQGDVDIVELLLKYKADVTIEDRDGRTPLHFSCKETISRMLISKGANVNAKTNKEGLSPIHWAAETQRDENVKVLLEYGVDVNCKDSEGATPLYCAACNGFYDLTEILLNNGAAVNDKTNNGTSPLHQAIQHGRTDVTSLLLQYDANVDDKVVLETADLRKCNEHDSELIPTASETIDVIEKHFITLKALELGSKYPNLPWMDFNAEENRRFYDSCKNQADLMTHEKISNTRVSFRDILTKSIHQVASYASNKSIIEAIELGEYKEKYPAYSKRIETKFKMAQKLEFLLKASARSLRSLISYDLPDVVIEGILSSLSYHHLRMLVQASPNATNEQCKT